MDDLDNVDRLVGVRAVVHRQPLGVSMEPIHMQTRKAGEASEMLVKLRDNCTIKVHVSDNVVLIEDMDAPWHHNTRAIMSTTPEYESAFGPVERDGTYQVEYMSKGDDCQVHYEGPMCFGDAVGTYQELQLEGFPVRIREVFGKVLDDYTSGFESYGWNHRTGQIERLNQEG